MGDFFVFMVPRSERLQLNTLVSEEQTNEETLATFMRGYYERAIGMIESDTEPSDAFNIHLEEAKRFLEVILGAGLLTEEELHVYPSNFSILRRIYMNEAQNNARLLPADRIFGVQAQIVRRVAYAMIIADTEPSEEERDRFRVSINRLSGLRKLFPDIKEIKTREKSGASRLSKVLRLVAEGKEDPNPSDIFGITLIAPERFWNGDNLRRLQTNFLPRVTNAQIGPVPHKDIAEAIFQWRDPDSGCGYELRAVTGRQDKRAASHAKYSHDVFEQQRTSKISRDQYILDPIMRILSDRVI